MAEKFVEFSSVKIAKEFSDVALKLVSGYSKLVRGVKKVQKTIEETNQAWDIDVVEIAKKTAVKAGNLAVDVAVPGAGKKTKMLGRIAESLMKPKNKQIAQNNIEEESDD